MVAIQIHSLVQKNILCRLFLLIFIKKIRKFICPSCNNMRFFFAIDIFGVLLEIYRKKTKCNSPKYIGNSSAFLLQIFPLYNALQILLQKKTMLDSSPQILRLCVFFIFFHKYLYKCIRIK